MTGLYVIFSKQKQEQLSKRRNGYQQYTLEGAFGYVREDHNTDFLGERQNDRIQMSSQWLADIKTVADDPDATFFFVDNRHREAVPDAIRRGLSLPISKTAGLTILIDVERRLAAEMMA